MSWKRHRSSLEKHVVEVLEEVNRPMSLGEIAKEVRLRWPNELQGETPQNSLYSIIYRREKRRQQRGSKPVFNQLKIGGKVFYELHKDRPNNVGGKIY
jgi:hypothetical protein